MLHPASPSIAFRLAVCPLLFLVPFSCPILYAHETKHSAVDIHTHSLSSFKAIGPRSFFLLSLSLSITSETKSESKQRPKRAHSPLIGSTDCYRTTKTISFIPYFSICRCLCVLSRGDDKGKSPQGGVGQAFQSELQRPAGKEVARPGQPFVCLFACLLA